MKNLILFWQPPFDLLKIINKYSFKTPLLIFLNYFIWLFFVYISFLLVIKDINIFWQLLAVTTMGEIIEKYGKSHAMWKRPFFLHHSHVPTGLVESWYETGSFPSGHTLKATFFFLFILQYGVISPTAFLSIVVPLLTFRVLVGFHYPIDMFGGAFFGFILWFFVKIITTYVFIGF
jgi:membrane-associated phospholipid phosphatase